MVIVTCQLSSIVHFLLFFFHSSRFFFQYFHSDYAKVRDDALKFWENGDSAASWLEILPEDMELTLPQNIEPLPEGGVQKRPPLVKSGTC